MSNASEPRTRGRPKAFHDKTAQNTIQSLDRAMMILEALAENSSQTLSEISEHLGQSPATVYRVLTTLEQRGITESNPVDQTWAVGPKAFLIGSSFLRRTSVVERARPFMRQLMETTGETANLGIAKGDHVLFISQAESHASIRAFFPPGTMSPLYASGIGKALLAFSPSDRVDEFLGTTPPEPFTEHTLIDPDALRADLVEIRTRGFSIDYEERTLGMRCTAAPVYNALGDVVAGISVSGPSSRMTDDALSDMGAYVMEAARNLSQSLGADL